jgi:hypothetical protein
MGILSRAWSVFLSVFVPNAERKFRRLAKCRESITDDEFAIRHYTGTGIPPEIAIRVRGILHAKLGLPNLVPSDNLAAILPDVDFAEIVDEVSEEFGVRVLPEEMRKMDGTVDSVIRAITKRMMMS